MCNLKQRKPVHNCLPLGSHLLKRWVACALCSQADGDMAIVSSGASHADMLARSHVPLLVREWEDAHAPPGPRTTFGFQVCVRPLRNERYPELVPEAGVDYTMPKGPW
jgi:hypothetical protein